MDNLASEEMRLWREVRPLILSVLERTDEYAIGDVLHYLREGKWQLWRNGGSIGITRIATYPRHKACVVVLAAGDIDEIVAMEPDVRDWARLQGCKYVEIYGRRGWAKALGYDEQHTVLRKAIS